MDPVDTRHRRRRALVNATAAAALLPVPALATTYDLTNQTVNLATATYTAADTLNCASTTLTSTAPDLTLAATVHIVPFTPVTTITSAGNITFAAALTGSAYLQKSGTGTLTLSAPAPAYTGDVTLSAGTLRLLHPDALGNDPYRSTGLSLAGGALDVSGAIPNLPVGFNGGGLANNSATPVTVGPALSAYSGKLTSFTLGGSGDLTFAAPLAEAGTLTKVGTGTVTYSTVTTFNNVIHVNAGTLRLGVSNPFGGWGGIGVEPAGTLDFNGFDIPQLGISTYGGSFVNNNTAATSNLNFLPGVNAGSLVLGGTGNLNLTAKAAPFTKTGAGTLTLSAANSTFAGTLTLNDGTVRLNNASAVGNSSASRFNLNGTATTAGVLDLNGFPAPAGTYAFNGGALVNNNTTTPVTLASSFTLTGSPSLGGTGNLVVNRNLPSTFTKVGAGTLVLNNPTTQSFADARVLGGTLLLGSQTNLSGINYYSGSLILTGSAPGTPYLPATVDLNGRNWRTPISLTLGNNGGVVNNNASTPAFLDTTTSITIAPDTPNPDILLGGEGRLNVQSGGAPGPGGVADFSRAVVHKIGSGLMVASLSPHAVVLHAGTYWAESNAAIGSSLTFLGGTLRAAPNLNPLSKSYTFTAPVALNPTSGNAIEAQLPTTFTGLLTGAGPLAKLGTASLTLNPAPSSRLALDVQDGALLLRPAGPSPTTLTSLSISPGAALDLPSPGLLLDYTGRSPSSAIRQYLHDNQLTSSSADVTHRLGYADSTTTLTIKLVPTGDANLDGTLNADDYALLDEGFAGGGTIWSSGDFNYDAVVDQNDYLLIDTAYLQQQGGTPSPSFLSQRESQFGADYVSQLLTSIPEPSSIACLFATLPLLARRRHRR